MNLDRDYLERRVAQEAVRAASAGHPAARDAHQRMRDAYARRIGPGATGPGVPHD